MVKVGLEMLKQTERIGLMELMKVSDIDMSDVNEETVGFKICLLYTSDAADDLLCVDLGGRRIIKKKKNEDKLHRYLRTKKNKKA